MADGTPRQVTVVRSAAARSWPNLQIHSGRLMLQGLNSSRLTSFASRGRQRRSRQQLLVVMRLLYRAN
jgi:hypothetical protein